MLRRPSLLFVTIVLSVSQAAVAQNTTTNPARRWLSHDQYLWLSHIQYLASDKLAGRETGSQGIVEPGKLNRLVLI